MPRPSARHFLSRLRTAWLRSSVAFWFALPCLICLPLPLMAEGNDLPELATPAALESAKRIQAVVDALSGRLSLAHPVSVSIVAENPLLVSIDRPPDHDGGFRLSFEDSFLNELTEGELMAVVAHELGHVWIFTHHPYLQTEQLANTIAMRVVSRESLEKVYEKVWERDGSKGDLVQFLGK
jgi:peptidase M48-like protein